MSYFFKPDKALVIFPFWNEQGYHAKYWNIQFTKSEVEGILLPLIKKGHGGVTITESPRYKVEIVKVRSYPKLVITTTINGLGRFLTIEGEDYYNLLKAISDLLLK